MALVGFHSLAIIVMLFGNRAAKERRLQTNLLEKKQYLGSRG
jgi:hypothetical protein